ncbi:MAG: glutathione S-transferase N-terminal domain-containing protein [Nitrospiraceae bacterium]
MALTFYHVTWCPECTLVRDKLTALGIPYEEVVVPDFQPFRKQVHEVSGQYYVPVLKDGDTVLIETREILAYLEQRYGADGARREAAGDGKDFPSCSL